MTGIYDSAGNLWTRVPDSHDVWHVKPEHRAMTTKTKTFKIPVTVLTILDRGHWDKWVFKLADERLDRPLYVEVNKVLDAAGGKWNRKLGGHVFEGDGEDRLEQMILTGEYTRTKQDLGQFASPKAVVARLIELARIVPGMDVLEPSAGAGAIVRGIVEAGGIPHAFEIDNLLRMKLEGSGLMQFPVARGDFLTFEPGEPFADRVVMNPPFAKLADIDHVMHAVKFLKPGGRLVSVMSAGIKFRSGRKAEAFQDFLVQRGAEIIVLPEGSFKESGTGVNTLIVAFDVP